MSEQTFIQIKNYYDRTIEIDDAEGNVVALPIRVRRFTLDQLQEYGIARKKALDSPHERLIFRKSDGDEQETREIAVEKMTFPVHVVPDNEIRRRRLAEMTREQLAEFEKLDEQSERTIAAFHRVTIRDHVWVPPNVHLVLEDETGDPREIKTGEDLVAAFAGNTATLKALGDAVFEENTMSAEAKKKSRLLSDLKTSSPASIPTAAGDAPGATVESVEASATAPSAAATEPLETIPSGSIAT